MINNLLGSYMSKRGLRTGMARDFLSQSPLGRYLGLSGLFGGGGRYRPREVNPYTTFTAIGRKHAENRMRRRKKRSEAYKASKSKKAEITPEQRRRRALAARKQARTTKAGM